MIRKILISVVAALGLVLGLTVTAPPAQASDSLGADTCSAGGKTSAMYVWVSHYTSGGVAISRVDHIKFYGFYGGQGMDVTASIITDSGVQWKLGGDGAIWTSYAYEGNTWVYDVYPNKSTQSQNHPYVLGKAGQNNDGYPVCSIVVRI